jgi:hypothetical protein
MEYANVVLDTHRRPHEALGKFGAFWGGSHLSTNGASPLR